MKKIILPLLAVVALTAFTLPTQQADREFSGAGVVLSATMDGMQEAPVDGDPDGSGYFEVVLNSGQGTITYMLSVQGISTPTGAHIHIAPAGSAGPVVVPLTPPVGGTSSGTIEVDKELIKEIRKNPEAYYVNVHNAEYPGGALRGQLSK